MINTGFPKKSLNLQTSVRTYQSNLNGKWMMFIPNSQIDKKWEQAVLKYRNGDFQGIHSMKSQHYGQKS